MLRTWTSRKLLLPPYPPCGGLPCEPSFRRHGKVPRLTDTGGPVEAPTRARKPDRAHSSTRTRRNDEPLCHDRRDARVRPLGSAILAQQGARLGSDP